MHSLQAMLKDGYIPQIDGMIHVDKNNACLRKSSPLLCFFAVQMQLWKTQTQLQKIRKQSCTAFQKTYACMYLSLFGRSLLICGAAAPQMHFGKKVLNVGVLFF